MIKLTGKHGIFYNFFLVALKKINLTYGVDVGVIIEWNNSIFRKKLMN